MKKYFLMLTVAIGFFACKKTDNLAPSASNEATALNAKGPGTPPITGAPPATVLCYVAYDGSAGVNKLVKFDALTGGIISNTTITGLSGTQKVLGGIARKKNSSGVYEYFITTDVAGVSEYKLNLTTSSVSTSVVLSPTLIYDYRNYLLENAPSKNYYYRRGSSIFRGTTTPTIATLYNTPALAAFGNKDGSLSFDIGNAGRCYANAKLSTTSAAVYRTPSITSPNSFVQISSNSYSSSNIFDEYHCLTIDDLGNMFIAYNGKFLVTKSTLVAIGSVTVPTFPGAYATNFLPLVGLAGTIITDMEVVY
jgi:hypothetical protein